MKVLCPAILCLAAACAATGGNTSNTGGSPLGGTTSSTGGSHAGGASVGGSAAGGSHAGGASAGGSATGGGPGAGGTGGASLPPSCASSGPGLSDCGDGESCCISSKVPGGTFYRTYKSEGSGATNTADPATISDFRLDKYLVTVGRFRKFVAAWDQGDGYLPAVGSGKHAHLGGGQGLADSGAPGAHEAGWLESYNNKLNMLNDSLECQSDLFTWTRSAEDREKLPMNCVNWFEAYAFCIWDDGFLPSEAEYVYAAAGGSEQRRFPWGSTDPGKSNQYAIYGCNYPDGAGTCDGTVRNLAPVGSAKLGAGRWGHLDLVGNLMEWYLDYFAQSYVSPCADCAYLADGSGRAPRDGYYGSDDVNLLLASYRNNGFYPMNRFYSSGFRCARTP